MSSRMLCLPTLLLALAALIQTPLNAATTPLHKGWAIQSASLAGASGEVLSLPGHPVTSWQPAEVPSTVLGTLIQNGVYKDPFLGKNLDAIPKVPFLESWWYRTEFQADEEAPGTCTRLIFDGINYRANVWLNGRKIADKESLAGVWRIADLEITRYLRKGANALAVEVFPPKPGEYTLGFVDWNPEPADRNMGLFREVRLRRSGAVSLEDVFVQSQVDVKTLQEATLTISADLVNHGAKAISGTILGRIGGIRFQVPFALGPMEKRALRLAPEQIPTLRIHHPRLWWPLHLGRPELYELELSARVGAVSVDSQKLAFGIREVKDYLNAQGHRGYTVNGKPVLIRGAAWVDDLFLREDPKNLEAQFRYIHHMNLNTIRLEGFWGCSQRLYDLADRNGILVMVGFSCQWEWPEYLGKPQDNETFGMAKDSDDTLLLASYLRDQVRWLRNHPSVFVWVLGSDKLPWPNTERHYRELLGPLDSSRPLLTSCKNLKSPVSGPSAVKMAGPYDYVTPNYWFEDRASGGAFGFNTETGPGPQIPPMASLRRMIPEDKLWPINDTWDYHCARHSFGSLKKFLTAYDQRYGPAKSAEELTFKAQASNYEAMRAMFDAFGTNRGEATGVIQWMLNGAWPKMFWQLYDSYLMPNGAFYGAKKSCQGLNAVYQVKEHAVYLLNETQAAFPKATLRVKLLDAQSRPVLAQELPAACLGGTSHKLLALPALEKRSPVYFLDLDLVDAKGKSLARNFYWLSSTPDVLDSEKGDWTYTPNKSYADFKALDQLPKAQVKVETTFPQSGECVVKLTNTSDTLAFFLELQLDGDSGPILPILWDDNYVSLLPHETRTLRARFSHPAGKPRLAVQGWNLQTP